MNEQPQPSNEHSQLALSQDFQRSLEAERARLIQLRQQALERKQSAEQELEQIESALSLLSAFEDAKRGKLPTAKPPRAPRKAGGRRGEKREAVLTAIKESTGGLSRRDILEVMGAKGDKSAEQSISNALSALLKSGQLKKHPTDSRKYLST